MSSRRAWLIGVLFVAMTIGAPVSAKVSQFKVDGVTVVLVPKTDFDYVTFQIIIKRGASADPSGKEGLANFMAQMLRRGADKLSQAQLAQQIEVLGSRLNISAGYRTINLSGDTLGRNLDHLMALVSKVLKQPTFAQPEIDKLKRLLKSRIDNRKESDKSLARYYFRKYLLRGHLYGRPVVGYPKTIDSLTREDIQTFHRTHFKRGNMLIGFSGNITQRKATELVKKYLSLPAGSSPDPAIAALPKPAGRRLLFIDKPGRTQTQIYIGHLGIKASSKAAFPLKVATTIFGGTFTARLMREIREKRGWSYGAYAYNQMGRSNGLYFLRFYPANKDTVPAITLALKLYQEFVAKGISNDELTFAQSYLQNSFSFKLDTAQKQLRQALRIKMLGLPANHLKTYVPKIKAVKLNAISKTLRQSLDAENLVLVVVGTWKTLKNDIAKIPNLKQILVNRYDREWDPQDVTKSVLAKTKTPR